MYKKFKISTYFLIVVTGMIHIPGLAQSNPIDSEVSTVSIEECYKWSKENYPLIKQMSIIEKTNQFNLSNASNGNLPQIRLNGQASYQSAVTQLPIEIPNMEIPTIDKDQYKLYGEVYQPLTNFSNVKANKKIISNNSEIEKQKIEVDLYQLKERINQIYFGILLMTEKIEQYQLIQSDLESTMAKVEAAIQNGTATITDIQLLNVEHISLSQQIEENNANKSAFLNMLSVLTGKNISEATVLKKPVSTEIPTQINRPELQLFDLQNQAFKLQEKLINNSLLPNLGLFFQGGYGRPALNFLSNDFDFYYLGGIKFNWNISSLYGFKNSKRILDLKSDKIENQREVFLLNTNLTQSQQSAEIRKYQNLIESDNEIIKIREEVLATVNVQLDNGLITTLDYVKYLNDVNKAKQVFLLHETQLLLAQFNLKTTTGN